MCFYHVTGDDIFSFDLSRCSSLLVSNHGFKNDEIELPLDFYVVVFDLFLMLTGGVSAYFVLIVCYIECAVHIVTSTSMQYVYGCTVVCGNDVGSSVHALFLLQCAV